MKEKPLLFPGISEKKSFWLLMSACALVFFSLLSLRALWDPGEGRYAAISREMLESGNWLVPHLNFVRYFEKPPLGYWLNALSMKVFGMNEFGARFFTALSGFLTVLGTYFFGRRVFNERTGILSAGVLFTSLGFFGYTQILELDMMLTFFVCFGLGLLYLGFEKRLKPLLTVHLGYLMLGLGCLVKGPVSFVLPFLIVGAYLFAVRGWGRWKQLYPVTGILLSILIAAPWFWAISVKEPGFLNFFFIKEHIQRFATTSHSRMGQFWYFVPVLILGMYPWTVVLPSAIAGVWRKWRKKGDPDSKPLIYLALWSVLIFLFFSFSGCKRPPYILLIFPPLAIMVGYYWQSVWDGSETLFKNIVLPFAAFNAVVGLGLVIAPRHIKYLDPGAGGGFFLPLCVLILGALHVALASRRRKTPLIFARMVLYAAFFSFFVYLGMSKFDAALSRKAMAEAIMSEFKEGEIIVSYHARYDRNLQSLGFYTGKRVRIVGGRGELKMGFELEPLKYEYFPSQEKFFEWVRSDSRVYVITREKRVKDLMAYVGKRLYPGRVLPGKIRLFSNKPWDAGSNPGGRTTSPIIFKKGAVPAVRQVQIP